MARTPVLPAAAMLGGGSGRLPPDAFLGGGSGLPRSAFLPKDKPTEPATRPFSKPTTKTSKPVPPMPKGLLNVAAAIAPETLAKVLVKQYGYSPDTADLMVEAFHYEHRFDSQRHRSPLSIIGTGLRKLENVEAGFVTGATRTAAAVGKGVASGDPASIAQVINPAWLGMHMVGGGFKEVPAAVGNDLTFQKVVKEHSNPDSLFYQYAMPIGLGMSVLFDPTTYLSVGASTPSKLAAYRLLAHTDKIAADEAGKRITRAMAVKNQWHHTPKTTNPITKRPYSWHGVDEAIAQVKLEHDMPFTLGDALDKIRSHDLAKKAEIRSKGGITDEFGNLLEASVAKKISSILLPTNVKGGRGVRIAGMSIPGTPELGAKMGKAMRGKDITGRGLGEAFVPEWAARHVVADATRASALTEMAIWRGKQQSLRSNVAKEVRPLARVTLRSEDIGDAGIIKTKVKVLPKQRVGLLHKPVETITDPALKTLRNNIEADADFHVLQAKRAGADEEELRSMWKGLSETYDDPLAALAEFKMKSTQRQLTKEFTTKILADLRFSRPMHTHAELKKGETGLLADVPTGFRELHYGGRRYAVHSSISSALEEINNFTIMDKEMAGFFRVINKPQQWWKIYATSPNPAFHVMNFLGAYWNNMLAGVYNPVDYMKAAQTLYYGKREEASQLGEKFLGREAVSSVKGKAALKHLSEAEQRTGLGMSSFQFGDVYHGTGLTKEAKLELQENVASKSAAGNIASRVFLPTPGTSKTRFALKRGRQAGGAALAAHLNPLAFVLFMPEAARAGRALGGAVEDMVRLAPFTRAAQDPAVRAAMAEYGPITVHGAMHKGWTKAHQAAMYDIGAHMSRHFQFDYTHLTKVERHIAKTFFPFWTYYRKNFVLQATELIKQPRKVGMALAMERYISENKDVQMGPWKELLPQYFEDLNAFQVPVPKWARKKLGLDENEPLFLNPKMPFVSLNLVPPLWDIVRDPATPTSHKVLESIRPIMNSVGPFSPLPFPGWKISVEDGTGWNFGLNRPIDFRRATSNDIQNSYVPAPEFTKHFPKWIRKNLFHVVDSKEGPKMSSSAAYLLGQLGTPFINNLGQSLPVSGPYATEQDEARSRADLISWVTGVRIIPVDILKQERSTAYNIRDILKSKQEDLRTQDKDLNDKEWEILTMLNAMIPELNDAIDERRGAKNG